MLTERLPGICPSCDKTKRLFDVEAMDGTCFCKRCVQRYGADALRYVANGALATRQPETKKFCLRCGAPALVGSNPYCSDCEGAYKARFNRPVRWGPA